MFGQRGIADGGRQPDQLAQGLALPAHPVHPGPAAAGERGERAGAAPMRLVPAQTTALRLMTGYVRDALSEPVLSSAPLADAVAAHLTELIALSLHPASAAAPPASLSGDLSYFNRAFRRWYGITPSEARRFPRG